MIFGSFWRSEPAAAFLGLANLGLPDSSSESFKSSNDCSGKKTSPRTSRVAGKSLPDNSVGTDLIVLISVIDNLIKGAAGQAIQNANLLFDLPESMGLNSLGLLP